MCISGRCISEISVEGPWKFLVGVASSDHKPGCNQLYEMSFNTELLKGFIFT